MRRVEFLLFMVFAVLLHVAVLWNTETGALPTAGGITAAGSTMEAMSDDLAELVESWDEEPEIAETTELEEQVTEDAEVDPLAELTSPDIATPAPVTPVDPPLANNAQPSPPTMSAPVTAAQLPETAAAPPPDTRTPEVQEAQDLELAELPRTDLGPALPVPNDLKVKPREIEPEPDPNRERAEPQDLQPLQQPKEPEVPKRDEVLAALPQPTELNRPEAPAVPSLAAPRIPEVEPEPEDTGPAPRIAALPVAKPLDRIPREVVTKPKVQKKKPAAQKKKKPVKKQTAKKKEPAKPAQAAKAETGTAPAQQGNQGEDNSKATARTEGAGGASNTGSFTTAAIASAKKGWVSGVQRAVARKKKYPRRAERRGVTGRAMIRVTLSASGKLLSVSLVKSSGSSMLDEAAIAAAKRVRSYPRIPEEMGRNQASVNIPIRFTKK
ncbi:MAG: TonB family protein [Pseudomonadota bacterium]